MFCKNCGNQLAEGAKFCAACGQPVSEDRPQKVQLVSAGATQGDAPIKVQVVEAESASVFGDWTANETVAQLQHAREVLAEFLGLVAQENQVKGQINGLQGNIKSLQANIERLQNQHVRLIEQSEHLSQQAANASFAAAKANEKYSNKKPSKIPLIICVMFLMGVAASIPNMNENFSTFIVFVFWTVVVVALSVRYYMRKPKKIAAKAEYKTSIQSGKAADFSNRSAEVSNQALATKNQIAEAEVSFEQKSVQIQTEIQAHEAEIQALQQQQYEVAMVWQKDCAPWFPSGSTGYIDLNAIDTFLMYFKNDRVRKLGEAINLYETEQHQMRLESNQRSMIHQQQIGNIINLWGHMGTHAAINRNTAAVNRVGKKMQAGFDNLAEIGNAQVAATKENVAATKENVAATKEVAAAAERTAHAVEHVVWGKSKYQL